MPYSQQQVTSKRRWSENVFSFTTTRPDDFKFINGQFVTLGLRPESKLISRAYSIISTNDDEQLEFLSIVVPNGPLTSRLAHPNVIEVTDFDFTADVVEVDGRPESKVGRGVWENPRLIGLDWELLHELDLEVKGA